ncbi:MAG: cation:proton antiporter [Deltaproteobacteria bacterium]|nr:cation:proton antiporter [Deltaproteobacteria bacterium]
MNSMMTLGVVLSVGFVFGEIASKFKLPRVTGYILGGIFLNPRILPLIPGEFIKYTDLATDLSLSFITFSVGASLFFPRIRQLGKTILLITFFEAECALLFVAGGFLALNYALGPWLHLSSPTMFIALSLLLASLASPTDPSATLAVAHEYHAKGKVSSTIMAVAGMDDIAGIINFSLCMAVGKLLLVGSGETLVVSLGRAVIVILGGIGTGIVFGIAFNTVTALLKKEIEGSLIVLTFSLLTLCFGLARWLHLDELLSTMAMGCVVVNFNPIREKILGMLERYTEELIFVLFFTLSGMYLDFSVLGKAWPFVLLFVALRGIGKIAGTMLGSRISRAPAGLGRHTAPGLIPQGGIVIGLALLIKAVPVFSPISDTVIAVIIGATVIHELIGPVLAKITLERAGEISL